VIILKLVQDPVESVIKSHHAVPTISGLASGENTNDAEPRNGAESPELVSEAGVDSASNKG